MKHVRHHVNQSGAEYEGRIAEISVYDMDSMRGDSYLDAALLEIRRKHGCGWQYPPLAKFVRELELEGIELTVQKHDGLSIVLDGFLEPCESNSGSSYRVADRFRGSPEYTLFSPFSFPIIDVTKEDMRIRARRGGYLEALEKSWFCHSPRPNGTPCGTCKPCLISIRQGMGYRVPTETWIRYWTRFPRRTYWAIRERVMQRTESGTSADNDS